jgi:DNA repair photolyase
MEESNNLISEISERFKLLQRESSYNSDFDLSVYEDFSKKIKNKQFIHTNVFELINTFSGCQNCHQSFQIDTYGKGCLHECIYCFAKNYGEQKNEWNNPLPLPMDITEVWHAFYTVFETSNGHEFRDVLSKKIPIRLGANSDCFMSIDRKFGVTKELLKILNHYDYPYLIVTRADIIAQPEYVSLLNKDLAAIHISIPSLNEELTKKIEPFAPSPKKRLNTIKTLVDEGFWVTARVNPLIPCYPDGHYILGIEGDAPQFFSYELIHEICSHGAQTILVGMITMPKNVMLKMSAALNFDLSKLMNSSSNGERFFYDFNEVEKYYEKIKEICHSNSVDFTTCYLGSGEPAYFRFKHLWDNQEDCCNAKNKVLKHKSDSRDIRVEERSTYIGDGVIQSAITKFCLKLMKIIFKGLDGKK